MHIKIPDLNHVAQYPLDYDVAHSAAGWTVQDDESASLCIDGIVANLIINLQQAIMRDDDHATDCLRDTLGQLIAIREAKRPVRTIEDAIRDATRNG